MECGGASDAPLQFGGIAHGKTKPQEIPAALGLQSTSFGRAAGRGALDVQDVAQLAFAARGRDLSLKDGLPAPARALDGDASNVASAPQQGQAAWIP